jgi:hypothetical protein
MMTAENLIFRIGAIGIGITGGAGWEYTCLGRFPDFLSAEIPHTNYEVKTNLSPVEPSSQPFFDTGIGWRLYQDRGQWVIWVPSRSHIPYLAGCFSPDFHSGEIFASESDQEPGKYIFPISFPLGELLMTNLLGTGYGIMLHSCGVIDGENGMVFAGISTAGKTTTARLWRNLAGVRVVNDDHTILRKIDGQFRVYGTPWHGEGGIALAEDAPLKKMFILKHALSNQAIRLSPAQAATALLVRTFAPLWSAPAMAFTMQFLDELCQTVPCYELGFVPDQSAVEYVRCLSSD